MKYRIGWVTNSSSSMYIIKTKKGGKPDVKEMLEQKLEEIAKKDPTRVAKMLAESVSESLNSGDNETGFDYIISSEHDRVAHAYQNTYLPTSGWARSIKEDCRFLPEDKRKEAAQLIEDLARELYGTDFMKRRYTDKIMEDEGFWVSSENIEEYIKDEVDLDKIRAVNTQLRAIYEELNDAQMKELGDDYWRKKHYSLPIVGEDELEPVKNNELYFSIDYCDEALANLFRDVLGAKEFD